MFTEGERKRIRAEERLRAEVREQVIGEAKKSTWKLLNEPFSLWLLSTIIVGLLTFSFAKVTAYMRLREDRLQAIEKLDVQCDARIEFALERRKEASDVQEYREILRILLLDTDTTRIYPEYRDRSTLSIVWEEIKLRKVAGRSTPHDDAAESS